MKIKNVVSVLSLITCPTAFSQSSHFSAFDGPVRAGYHISSNQDVHFSLNYTGYLYTCTPPHYEGTPVTAVFSFGVGEDRFPYKVKMSRSCTTPWSYMLPTVASINTFVSSGDGSSELWNLIRTQIEVLNAPLGVAFQDENGRWDSVYGRNYQLTFRAEE